MGQCEDGGLANAPTQEIIVIRDFSIFELFELWKIVNKKRQNFSHPGSWGMACGISLSGVKAEKLSNYSSFKTEMPNLRQSEENQYLIYWHIRVIRDTWLLPDELPYEYQEQ